MNQSHPKALVSTLTIAVLAFSAVEMQAQDPAADVIASLSISATAQYQVDPPVSDTSSITKHTIKTVKLNLLALMATNLEMNVKDLKGYSLVLMGGTPTLYKKATKTTDADSIDVSSMLSIDPSGTTINSGQEDSATGATSSTASTYTTITFDDGLGNAFTLTGIAKITSSVSAANNKNGDPLVDKNGDPRPQAAPRASDGRDAWGSFPGTSLRKATPAMTFSQVVILVVRPMPAILILTRLLSSVSTL